MMNFKIKKIIQQQDEYGGFEETYPISYKGVGYLDMLTGSNESTIQNTSIEQSTHILITDYFDGYETSITDSMIADIGNKRYRVTYVDNPVGLNHHLEIYLRFDTSLGDANGR